MDGAGEGGTRAAQRRRTEARVLAEARKLFSSLGYDRTTIRAVAAAARVDPGLVMRYFGSKSELFAKAAEMVEIEPEAGSTEQVAQHLLSSLTAKLETEPTATLAMLRSMLTHPEAAAGVQESIARQQHQLSQVMDLPDASLRTALFGAITLGVIVGRYLLELDGLRDASPEEVAEVLRPCIEALTHGGDPVARS
ncbi:MAG TPA: TetR family transcriptional regulator [Pseudonocardiaceae bacterium]|jgi:AcrR family transcriptional regulator|nr:TetR family transcriptional regulator [Pseudonocardiaceae bacterium]